MVRKPIKLTQKAIDRLKPEASRYTVRFEGTPGLELRVAPTAVMTFSYTYRTKQGCRERYTIGRYGKVTPDQVRGRIKSLDGRIERGESPQQEKRGTRATGDMPTLKGFVDGDYGDWLHLHHRSGTQTSKRIVRAFDDLKNTPLDQITVWLLDKWQSRRLKEGVSKSTIRRDLAALGGALSRAVEWKLIEANPIASRKRQERPADERNRYLSTEEENRLRAVLDDREAALKARRVRYNDWRSERHLSAVDGLRGKFADHVKPMVLLSLHTGLRRGELFSLRWAAVDLCRRNLRVLSSASKTARSRDIPLNDEALSVLRSWKAQQKKAHELVFPSRGGLPFTTIKTAWSAVVKDANIRDFRWHDLRHTFASKLVMVGVDLNTVRELLGHADLKMTLRYSHLAPEHKASAVAKLVGNE